MAGTGAKRGGFTLIELLTVITIIGLLAGLVVGLGPGASRNMKEKRVKSDLRQLETAIENYKAKYGSYPPDNQFPVNGNPQSHFGFPNQLYYELKGCFYQASSGAFQSVHNSTVLKASDLHTVFNTDGIQNAGEDRSAIPDFFKELKPPQVVVYTNFGGGQRIPIYALTVPVAGPNGPSKPNYWNYVSKNPTNNAQTFDLWAVVVIGRTTNVIGNW
jgi:prepilin-type N-terminal cleavage/methylation domain-containing protein